MNYSGRDFGAGKPDLYGMGVLTAAGCLPDGAALSFWDPGCKQPVTSGSEVIAPPRPYTPRTRMKPAAAWKDRTKRPKGNRFRRRGIIDATTSAVHTRLAQSVITGVLLQDAVAYLVARESTAHDLLLYYGTKSVSVRAIVLVVEGVR